MPTWTGKASVLRNLDISARTRMYQYSRRDGLFVGLGLTYMGSVVLVAQAVLMRLAWWNMYLSLESQHAARCSGMRTRNSSCWINAIFFGRVYRSGTSKVKQQSKIEPAWRHRHPRQRHHAHALVCSLTLLKASEYNARGPRCADCIGLVNTCDQRGCSEWSSAPLSGTTLPVARY